MNDADRQQLVDNDEGLYDMQRRSRLPARKWLRENRALIDSVDSEVRSGKQSAHFLKYGRAAK